MDHKTLDSDRDVLCKCNCIHFQSTYDNLGLILNNITCKHDKVAEWLRRQTANLLGSARVSSNLILVEIFFDSQILCKHAQFWPCFDPKA
jgi:hypothetical protein